MAYPVTPTCVPAFNEHRVRFLLDVHAIVLVYAVTLVQAHENAVMPHALNGNVSNTPASTKYKCSNQQKNNGNKAIKAAYICTPFLSHHIPKAMRIKPTINTANIQRTIKHPSFFCSTLIFFYI